MRFAFPLVVVTMFLASCASSGPEVGEPVDKYPESLLIEALDIEDGDPLRSVAVTVAGECLREEGFSIDPHLIFESSARRPVAISGAARDLPDDEFAEQYGFGIAQSVLDSMTELVEDPMKEYTDSLSVGEVEAFRSALYDRCLPEAIAAEQAEEGTQAQALFGEYSHEIQLIIDADPEQVDILRRWSSCMAEKGYQYRTMRDARTAARDRIDGWVRAGGDADAIVAQEIREAVDSLACEALLRTDLIKVRERVEAEWISANLD